jgi:hypothetical protein
MKEVGKEKRERREAGSVSDGTWSFMAIVTIGKALTVSMKINVMRMMFRFRMKWTDIFMMKGLQVWGRQRRECGAIGRGKRRVMAWVLAEDLVLIAS